MDQTMQLQKEIVETQQSNTVEIKTVKEKYQKELNEMENEKSGLDHDLDNLKATKTRQIDMEANLRLLELTIKQEKKDRMIEVNEMEREKIQATEKLRKEMLYKIKETKANLLALNDEQLQTTTRLTILQNHQLTTELENQSKQTEELLTKNNKMRGQIDKIKRDIAIHKEVEKELAKRSHFCQRVIKKLKGNVEMLEQ